MCIKPPTPKDKLSLELVTSPPRKKSITIFMSQVINLEEDEEQTCSNKMGGGGGEELQAIVTQGNMEENFEPNLL
jgi:hypothetical protein